MLPSPHLRLATFLVWLLACIVPTPALADSWLPPSTETVLSENGRFRFTVEPSPIESSLSFFSEELAAQRDGRATERVPPMGLLEVLQDDGQWAPVWAGPLVNSVAPASFLVSDKGTVVTFDNWHSVGHGEHVIVIYNDAGVLVRSMPLLALLPEDYIEVLPHSTSSLSWRQDASFSPSGQRLILDILVPSENSEPSETVRFVISLTDGAIERPDSADWSQALEAKDRVVQKTAEAEAARLAYLREPLSAPQGCNMRDWHRYLNEAFFRLTPNWLDLPSTSTTILFPPDHDRFETSVGWLADEIADLAEFEGNAAIAAPCSQPELVVVMRRAFSKVSPGALAQSSIYISADTAHQAALEEIVAPSGASIYWLDPEATIAQRPERIPGSAEEAAASEEIWRRQEAEMTEMLQELGGL